MIALEFYTYKVGASIYRTKHEFARRFMEWIDIDGPRSIYHRCVKLFVSFYMDSVSSYPTGRLIPSRFRFEPQDVWRYVDTYKGKTPDLASIVNFEDRIYKFFMEQMQSVVPTPLMGVNSKGKTFYVYPQPTNMNRSITRLNSLAIEQRPTLKLHNLSPFQLRVLRERYQGDSDSFDRAVLTMLYIYSALSTTNFHLSIPPLLLSRMQIDVELFGSPLNTYLNRYCSVMPEIESVFGSLGNYFNYTLVSNSNYTFNPPYIHDFMVKAVKRLKAQVVGIQNYMILGVMPAWDVSAAFDLVKTIPTFRGYVRVSQSDIKFFDYYEGGYLAVCDAYIFVISDREKYTSLDKILEMWNIACNN